MDGSLLLAVSDTVSVGALTAAVGALGVTGTVVAARRQAKSAMAVATNDRFAAWQILKREVYAEFVEAARALRDELRTAETPDPAVREAFARQAHRVLFYAYEKGRLAVEPIIDDPGALGDDEVWRALVETLREDVHATGRAT